MPSATPNATMAKFGYPDTLIGETASWAVLLRPAQPTLGALVLAAKSEAYAFSALPPGAFADLGLAVAKVERMLRAFVAYDRINYLMLMMVDPDVHMHVIPRYNGAREHGGLRFPDAGWPGQPELGQAVTLEPAIRAELRDRLSRLWNAL